MTQPSCPPGCFECAANTGHRSVNTGNPALDPRQISNVMGKTASVGLQADVDQVSAVAKRYGEALKGVQGSKRDQNNEWDEEKGLPKPLSSAVEKKAKNEDGREKDIPAALDMV